MRYLILVSIGNRLTDSKMSPLCIKWDSKSHKKNHVNVILRSLFPRLASYYISNFIFVNTKNFDTIIQNLKENMISDVETGPKFRNHNLLF